MELKVKFLRAHKGHSPDHGPGGSVPLSAINSGSFLIAQIAFIENSTAIPGFEPPAEYYADVFLNGLVCAIHQLQDSSATVVPLSYHHDQGEPLISFERTGDRVTISVIEDEGEGERWDYDCGFEEFTHACALTLAEVRSFLVQHAGAEGESFYQTKIISRRGA